MLQKIKRLFLKNKYMLAAFFVPFMIMALVCMGKDYFPFGDNQIAIIDMYHQYVPFLNELQHKLQNFDSLFYSWNGAGGTNFVSLLAYYTASPLNLLLILVPQKFLMEAVTLLVFTKIGLAGLFMNIYFKGMHHRQDCATVAFSTMYALCAYMLGYYWNIMWLDGVALFPLIILGLNRLMDKGDIKLYVITLALSMLSNYYIGGMTCIFILFYFPVLYFSKKRNLGVKGCVKTIGTGVLSSLSAILISACLLVPTFLSLQNTYYIDSEMPDEVYFYRPILDVLNNLMPQMEVTVREGAPNIYCGLFCVIMFAYFLLCDRIPVRKKIANCVMLAFLVLSFNMNQLDFIWHGFHFPNQIPFRYSFAFSFLLVAIAYDAFKYLHRMSPKMIASIAAAGAAYIIVVQKIYEESVSDSFAYIALLLLFMYSGFMAMYRTEGFERRLVKLLLLVMVMFEMVVSVDAALTTTGHTSRNDYFRNAESVCQAVDEIREEDPGLYRMEIDNSVTLNSPMMYNYPGISQFSSTVNESATNFMVSIGIEGGGAKNRFTYALTDPVTDSILGIKYLIGRGTTIDNEKHLKLVKQVGNTHLYENEYALSMGYMVNPALLHAWDTDNDNPFHRLNDYVKLATDIDEKVFTEISGAQIASSGAIVDSEQNGYFDCRFRGDTQIAKVELTYTIPESQQVYAFVESDQVEYIAAERSDGTEFQLPTDVGGVISMGHFEKGQMLKITVEYKEKYAEDIEAYIYGLDRKVWDEAYAELSDEMMQITDYSSTVIEGTITAEEDGMCIISVPYEKGWTVRVDGRKKDIQLLEDCMIAVPLSEGEHQIELKFVPNGMIPGIVMTVCGLIIFGGMCIVRRRKD